MGSYIITSPSWNKLSISHLLQMIVPNEYNEFDVDQVVRLLLLDGCDGFDILLIIGVLGVRAVVKSIRHISGVSNLCSYIVYPSDTLCCCTLFSVGCCSIDCSDSTALVSPNDCGRNGDIGGGSLSTVSKSSIMSDYVSVGVIVGSSAVVGKKFTVLDCRIFLVVPISIYIIVSIVLHCWTYVVPPLSHDLPMKDVHQYDHE